MASSSVPITLQASLLYTVQQIFFCRSFWETEHLQKRKHLICILSSSPGLTPVLESASPECPLQFYSTTQIQHHGALLIKTNTRGNSPAFFFIFFSSKYSKTRIHSLVLLWVRFLQNILALGSMFNSYEPLMTMMYTWSRESIPSKDAGQKEQSRHPNYTALLFAFSSPWKNILSLVSQCSY